jgi:catechol 2,3-dioxygenase-like lactoylglutathione lyase family enzyme
MQLFEVILNVDDMDAQVSFYRDTLGLTVQHADPFWTTFETGACTLALHGGGGRKIGEDAGRIVFRVDDVAHARDELTQRGVELGDIRSPAPGVLVVDGRDPEGNPFHLEQKE